MLLMERTAAARSTDTCNQTLGIKFITSPEIVYIARNSGFHALFIDLEHSTLSLETAGHLCVAAMNAGLSPIVRVPGQAGPGLIQRVLDSGAQGVIVPHVDTVRMLWTPIKHDPILLIIPERQSKPSLP